MANQSLPELLAQAQAFNEEENFIATYALLIPEVLQQHNNASIAYCIGHRNQPDSFLL